MRNGRYLLYLMLIMGTLAGCGKAPAPDAQQDAFTVILVTDIGGLGDKGFNDAGWLGCQEAKERLAANGVTLDARVIESREQTDYADNLNLAAERADMVIGLGFLIADAIKDVAAYYPQKHFLFIDGELQGDNIASFEFHAEQGGFLAGLLASYVTRTGTIAAMPGMDIPPVLRFAAGFEAGAHTGAALQNREIKTLRATIGGFNDPVKGKSLAQSLLSQGADILFQLAGNSGLGVLEAIKEAPEGAMMIGVDIDQDSLAPGRVLTSVLKRMDRVVADQIVSAQEGAFEPGVYWAGMTQGYVGLTEMKYTKDKVPEEALLALDKARVLISQNLIVVPSNADELKTFELPLQQFNAE